MSATSGSWTDSREQYGQASEAAQWGCSAVRMRWELCPWAARIGSSPTSSRGQRRAPTVPASIACTLATLLVAGAAACGGDDPEPSWTLVWSDEFEGPASELPDAKKWAFDIGTDWGNRQLEYDTDRAENISLDGDGNLAITAREESYMGSAYTSGRIKTLGLFEQAYGRFEARIKLPVGQGIWPAFWMLGENFPTIGWPQCGEIDIMEYRGQEPSVLHGTIHGPGYSAASGITSRYVLPDGRFDTDFHTFAIEWSEEGIVWFVDDTIYHSVGRSDTPGQWVFDQPFFILLNVAVGGHFVGSPDASTTFPQSMLVDWVRVHQRQ